MPTFHYRAVDREGRHTRGELDAVNDVDLELRLRRMGLDMIGYRALAPRALAARGRIGTRELISLCFDLEQISRAGIPMIDGLRDLRDGVDNPRLREILTSVVEDMEAGRLLSQCLARHPQVFGNVFVSLVRAGEQSGQMSEVFENLGATLRMQDELASQTRRLLVYPTIVLLVVLAVMVFLFTYLVPQVTGLLRTMGIALPVQTRVMIAISEAVRAWWPLLLLLPALLAAGAGWAVRTRPAARHAWDWFKLHLPLTGPLLQRVIMARFANVFALLYRSGITILDALHTCEAIADNRVVGRAIARATGQIDAGVSLTEAFRDIGGFPPLVIRMLRVGEATGALDTALVNITYFYDRDVRESIERGLKLLEPVLVLALGGCLLLIMWAVLSPVYDILGKLQL